jgi:hypothetical protein
MRVGGVGGLVVGGGGYPIQKLRSEHSSLFLAT